MKNETVEELKVELEKIQERITNIEDKNKKKVLGIFIKKLAYMMIGIKLIVFQK